MADAMVVSGMAAAGFSFVNLDDGWAVARGSDGSITPDPVRFPSGMKVSEPQIRPEVKLYDLNCTISMKALAQYLHARGE